MEGDVISISCQEDFEEAIESGVTKLLIEQNCEAAKANLEMEASIRSSVAGKMGASFFFEEVKGSLTERSMTGA